MIDAMDARRTVSIVVTVVSAILAILSVVGVLFATETSHVSLATVSVQLFALIMIFTMMQEWRHHGGVFLLTLIFVFVIFYYSRVTTLVFFPYSAVLLRNGAGAGEVTFGFFIACVGTASLFFGIKIASMLMGGTNNINAPTARPLVSIAAYTVVMAAFIFTHFVSLSCSPAAWMHYAQLFIDPNVCVVLLMFVIFSAQASNNTKRVVLVASVLVILLVRSMIGSRSGVLSVVYPAIMLFGIFGEKAFIYLMVNRVFVAIGGVIAVVILGVMMFSVGDYMRSTPLVSCSGGGASLESFAFPTALPIGAVNSNVQLGKIAERMGALDNTVDIAANREMYSEIISIEYYINSIVDGLFIGSMDGAEKLRASIMLKTVYAPHTAATVYSKDAYHSDIITPFAELYVLGGWLGLVAGCIAAGAAAGAVGGAARQLAGAWQIFWLLTSVSLWWGFLNSYGLDWVVVEGARIALTIAAFSAMWAVLLHLSRLRARVRQ